MKLNRTLQITTNRIPDSLIFLSKYVLICGGSISVLEGWQWDGCTFAKDSPYTNNASCIHDALLSVDCGIPRGVKDLIFYDELKKNNFKWCGWLPFSCEIYYIGVRIGSLISYLRGKKW